MKIYSNKKVFSLSDLLFVVIVTGIVAAISIPTLLSSRTTTSEAAAVATLRMIQAVQSVYRSKSGGSEAFATFNQLRASGLLDETFTGASIVKNNYVIDESVNAAGSAYCAKASPVSSSSGAKYFGINEKGVVYQAASKTEIDCTAGVLTTGSTASPVY